MIDSGAAANFISKRFLGRLRIQDQPKQKPYKLRVIDRSVLSEGRVHRETRPLQIKIQRHHKDVTLDITDIASHNIVLGTPWLKENNPKIDWVTGRIKFGSQGNATLDQPTHQQRTMVDKEKRNLPKQANRQVRSSLAAERYSPLPSKAAEEIRKSGALPSLPENPYRIPREYHDLEWVFEEGIGE